MRGRVSASPHGFALVTTAERVLLGRLRASALAATADGTAVGEVIEPGPSTLRPHQPVADVRSHLQERGLTYAIVSDPDGDLLGTVRLTDLT